MKLHASNERVMVPACYAVKNIACIASNHILIAKAGGIPILLNVMKLHASFDTIYLIKFNIIITLITKSKILK